MNLLKYLAVLLPLCNYVYSTPKIEIRVGSDSDLPRIQEMFSVLDQLDIDYELNILSAHRTPHEMMAKAETLAQDGFVVCIGSAGGSAHLPGMTASETSIPVIALPVKTSYLDGLDSLLSMVQMPPGIPNGAVGINQSKSAAIAAAQIAYLGDHQVMQKICNLRNISYKEHNPLSKVAIIGTQQKNLKVELEKVIELFHVFDVETIEYDINEEGFLTQAVESGCSALYFVCDVQNEGLTQCQHLAKSTFLPFVVIPYFESKTSISAQFFHQLLSNEAILSMGINQFSNGALYCLEIIGNKNALVRDQFNEYRRNLSDSVRQKNHKLQEERVQNGTYLKSWIPLK
jgi:5-(carboxyamino)imidazole ribonucleotide mutase